MFFPFLLQWREIGRDFETLGEGNRQTERKGEREGESRHTKGNRWPETRRKEKYGEAKGQRYS